MCAFLEARGWRIVARNLRVGRREIDIVAVRGRVCAFCEVRARAWGGFVSPLATIDRAKVRRVRSAAAEWMRAARARGELRRHAMRFDAAAVTFDEDAAGRVDYVEDAF